MNSVSDKNISQCDWNKKRGRQNNGVASAVYGLGLIGALFYFMQHAASFWLGVLGVIKSLIWPALLVYKALDLLKM